VLLKESEKRKEVMSMAIKYDETSVGDILRVVGAGAPGIYRNGDLVRVKGVYQNGVLVEDKDGKECEFVFNCGAARLEATEWKADFPEEAKTP
jgi:hypothetical protein